MRFFPLGLLTTVFLGASGAQAVSLTVSSRLVVSGPVQLAGLAALPDAAAACLGSRLLLLNAGGQLQRAIQLGGECQSLTLSPSGKLALTVQNNQLSLWQLPEGRKLQDLPAANPLHRAGFLSDDAVLWASVSGIESFELATGKREKLTSGQATALFVAPNGQRAILGDGQKVQLVQLPDLKVLSGTPCDAPCQVTGAWFSSDQKTATAFAGRTLFGLRDGYPGTTIVRDSGAAAGLPLPNNTVLTLSAGNAESRDLQTGRRESILLSGIQASWLAATAAGRILAVSTSGELLESDPKFTEVRRLPLPARVLGGGWDGQPLALLPGGLLMRDGRALSSTFWAIESMNKTTWALTPDGEGGLQLNVLAGSTPQKRPGLRTATHLSVNHWGNAAAVWNDAELAAVSQAGTLLASYKPAAGTLKEAQVVLSPDATRAFIFPSGQAAYVVTLKTGQRNPLNAPALVSGQFYTGLQISGEGLLALLDSAGQVRLLRPNDKTALAALPGSQGFRFSPNNRWLAVPVSDAAGVRVNLVLAQTGKVVATTPPLAERPTFLTWSADSQRLVIGAGLLDDLNSVTVVDLRE